MINSLDEAIKNCEKVADGFDEKAQEIAMQDENGVYQPRVSWFQDLASRQRQLAEWLRELKGYRIFKEVLYKHCDEWCKFPQYRENKTMCGACDIGSVQDLLENALEEVNADDR